MKRPLFPAIGPEEERRYIAASRKRRAERKREIKQAVGQRAKARA